MAGLSDLSVRITSKTKSFERGVENSQDKLRGLLRASVQTSGALQLLGGRADEAGDEVSQLGNRATLSSMQLQGLAGAAFNSKVSFLGLSVATTGALVPALVTLSAALVPVVAALGGFITVAGAIAGVGLVGALGAAATRGEALKTQLQSLWMAIQEEFAPAFNLAYHVLSVWIDAFRDILPELLPAESLMQRIAGSFAYLGEVLISSLPAFVELATTLTSEFLPPFTVWLDDFLPRVPGLLDNLVRAFDRMLPKFMEAGRLLGRLAGPLLEFGWTALNVVGPALGRLTTALTDTLTWLNSLDRGVKQLVARVSLLMPVITGLIGVLGGLPGVLAVGAIVAFGEAWESNFANIRGITERFMTAVEGLLGDRLPRLLTEVRKTWQAWKPYVEPVINFLANALGTVVVGALDSVFSIATAVAQLLRGDFAGAFTTLEGLFVRTFTRIAEFINRFTNEALEGLVNSAIKFINTFGRALEDFMSYINQGDRFDFQAFEQVDIGTAPFSAGAARTQGRAGDTGMGRRAPPPEVSVTLEGELPEDSIRDVSVDVVRAEERRGRRNTGSNRPV